MTPTLFHYLGHHVSGWSHFYTNPLDIRRIISITYHKRLFCIFDTKYKYTMKIKYNGVGTMSPSSIEVSKKKFYTNIPDRFVNFNCMSVRYESEQEIIKEIDKIKDLQDIIIKYDYEQDILMKKYSREQKVFF